MVHNAMPSWRCDHFPVKAILKDKLIVFLKFVAWFAAHTKLIVMDSFLA